MSKISEIYYEEINPSTITIQKAGEFYYHFNLVGVHSMFHDEYEKYEMDQLNIRNKVIGDAIKRGDIKGSIRTDKSMIAISSLKNKVVMIAELN